MRWFPRGFVRWRVHQRQVKYISRGEGGRFLWWYALLDRRPHSSRTQIEVFFSRAQLLQDVARPLIEARHRSCDGKWHFKSLRFFFFSSFRFLDAQFFLPSMRNKEEGIFGFFSITRKKIKGVLFLRDRKKKWDYSSSFRREDFIRIFESKFKKRNNERASKIWARCTFRKIAAITNRHFADRFVPDTIIPIHHGTQPAKAVTPLPLPPPGISSSTTRTPTGVQSRQVVT